MHFHQSVGLFAMALLAFGQAQQSPVYDCNVAKHQCESDVQAGKTAQSVCQQKNEACLSCTTREHSCRVGAAHNYSADLHCTAAAEVCYNQALSPGSTIGGYYPCAQAFASCSSGPQANHSLCASQKAACESCQTKENQCRYAPRANQSFCSSQATSCFEKAVSF